MARCLKNEKDGRITFYGAMILEGIIAMIWAAVTMAHHFNLGTAASPELVVGIESAVAAPVIVTQSSLDYMKHIGGILVVFGVVACPITSGDTAFRSARLTIADIFKYEQKPIKNRLFVAIPLFAIGLALVLFSISSVKNFNIIWRYFAWSNQTLATIGLWAISAYLAKTDKLYWISLLPAAFMTVVVTSYFFTSTECLGPLMTKITGNTSATYNIGICIGLILSAALSALFIRFIGIKQKGTLKE
jgi:carbon starvation protein CstA